MRVWIFLHIFTYGKLTTVRILFITTSIHNRFLHQLDVNNAFLHEELQEDVYITLPESVPCTKVNQVFKLLNNLYDLKHASRKWYEKLTSLLVQQRYTPSNSYYSLFTIKQNDTFTTILVHDNDIILGRNSMSYFDKIKTICDKDFIIKNLGLLKYFLDLEVVHSIEGISISQKILFEFVAWIWSSRFQTCIYPYWSSIKLHTHDGKPFEDIDSYRKLFCDLLYLNTTIPNITFAT